MLSAKDRSLAPPELDRSPATPSGVEELSFERIYRTWFREVMRWARALGVPLSEIEDLAQEIFIVVHRKLPTFAEGNLAGWLYRITELTVRDQRRRAWFKYVIRRQRDVEPEDVLESSDDPTHAYEVQEERQIMRQVLAGMSEKRRSTFVLFEIEGFSGDQIATLQGIPLRTVWTRLHHARKDFMKMLTK